MGKTPEQHDWQRCARMLRLVAHPARLMILRALAERSQCVRDINTLVPIPQPHLSQHMAVLRRAELVDCHTHGSMRCYYVLRPRFVRQLVRLLCEQDPPKRRSREAVLREIRRAEKGASGRKT